MLFRFALMMAVLATTFGFPGFLEVITIAFLLLSTAGYIVWIMVQIGKIEFTGTINESIPDTFLKQSIYIIAIFVLWLSNNEISQMVAIYMTPWVGVNTFGAILGIMLTYAQGEDPNNIDRDEED